MSDVEDDLLSVRDLGLAAALISLDYRTVGTRLDDTGRVYFLFLKSSELHEAVTKYWGDVLLVKARHYSDTVKALKTQIYNEKGQIGNA